MSPPTPSAGHSKAAPAWWRAVLCGAMAGGMGWGIRGQYGHETGAMIAGLLVSLVLVMLFCPAAALLPAARAVAMGTIAIGFGGSMTYGQTVGLTHDPAMVGNVAGLRWGLLGLGIKGGIWIGFAGLFLGMGLGGVRYRVREILLLMLGFLALYGVGVHLLNRPFDPANHVLPKIYFSADWHWRPGAELKPRRECWGGLLLALLGGWAWAGGFRRDALARNLMLWGFLGGAIGFPLGQSLQAFHAWHPEFFKIGLWVKLDPVMNWWNWMETTFGAVMGGGLGLGLWLNRHRVADLVEAAEVGIPRGLEWMLVATHVLLLLLGEFGSVRAVSAVYDLGLILGLIPMVAVSGGRWWPFLLTLPITALPIAGKSIRVLVGEEHSVAPALAWCAYGILPMGVAIATAAWLARGPSGPGGGHWFARRALVISTWLYFGLNFAFFRYPWPWQTWTARTPNAIVYTLCAIGLTFAALRAPRQIPDGGSTPHE